MGTNPWANRAAGAAPAAGADAEERAALPAGEFTRAAALAVAKAAGLKAAD